jgi:hypothetical protein
VRWCDSADLVRSTDLLALLLREESKHVTDHLAKPRMTYQASTFFLESPRLSRARSECRIGFDELPLRWHSKTAVGVIKVIVFEPGVELAEPRFWQLDTGCIERSHV